VSTAVTWRVSWKCLKRLAGSVSAGFESEFSFSWTGCLLRLTSPVCRHEPCLPETGTHTHSDKQQHVADVHHYIFHLLPVFVYINAFPLCFHNLWYCSHVFSSLSFHIRTLGSNFLCRLFLVLNRMSITNNLCFGTHSSFEITLTLWTFALSSCRTIL